MQEEKFIISENGKVFYYINRNERSDAKSIFFLHGLGIDHNTFTKQVEFFRKEYTVINWDAPFHKQSRPYNNFTISNCVTELYRILEAERIDKIILVGQSMGGVISQHFIDRYKGRVDLFIGIGSPPVGLKYLSKLDGKLLKFATMIFRLMPYNFLIKSSVKGNALTDEGRRYVDWVFRFYNKKEFIELTEIGFMQMVYENKDIVIDCPALALFGDKENIGKSKFFQKVWADISRRPIRLIKNSAHLSNMDNPVEVNTVIDEFIKSHSMF